MRVERKSTESDWVSVRTIVARRVTQRSSGRLLPPRRDEIVEHLRVDDAAEEVLRARVRAPLEQADRSARPRQHEGGGASRRGRRRRRRRQSAPPRCRRGALPRGALLGPDAARPPPVIAASAAGSAPAGPPAPAATAGASATRARSAIDIIGQLRSRLTEMTWSGEPRPPTCCAAPEMPRAT